MHEVIDGLIVGLALWGALCITAALLERFK